MSESITEQFAAVGKMFSRRWWLMTLVVIAGVFGLMRLGVWQLHRRDYKRSLNEMMAERWQMAAFNLNQEKLPTDLINLQFRHVQATGKFDYAHQIILKNYTLNETPGVSLITPLLLDDQQAILVARGWLPIDQATPEKWAQFNEKSDGTVIGLIQDSQAFPEGSKPTVSQEAPLKEWWRVDISAIQPQMPYKLLPGVLLMLTEPGRKADVLPVRADEPTPFDELEHTSYAWQWFSFGVILAFGYLQLIVQQERKAKRLQAQAATTTPTPAPETAEVDLATVPHNV